MRPPQSPDINPLDYRIRGTIGTKVSVAPHKNLDDLRVKITEEWKNLSKYYVVKVCRSFRPCVQAVVDAGGSHIEK